MDNYAGPSPFNPSFADWFSKRRSSKNKRAFAEDTSKGFRGSYAKERRRGVQDGTYAPYRKRRLKSALTGDTYDVPEHDANELEGTFMEQVSKLSSQYGDKKLLARISTPADYIDYAFQSKQQQANITAVDCKGGHIARLEYNAICLLLKVTFLNRGDVVVFFNLPAQTAALLMLYARNNTMAPPDRNGRPRHALGVEFWNLVRVRGTVHNTRFPFQYTVDLRTGGMPGRKAGFVPPGERKYVYATGLADRRFNQGPGIEVPKTKYPVRLKAGTMDAEDYIAEAEKDAREAKAEALEEKSLKEILRAGNAYAYDALNRAHQNVEGAVEALLGNKDAFIDYAKSKGLNDVALRKFNEAYDEANAMYDNAAPFEDILSFLNKKGAAYDAATITGNPKIWGTGSSAEDNDDDAYDDLDDGDDYSDLDDRGSRR